MRVPEPDHDLDALLRHGDQVRRLALRLCADAHGVDDAVQDAWLAALRSPPRHRGNVRGWFAALLRNSVRQRARAERRRDARDAALAREERVEATDEAVARAELHQRLVAEVLALSEPQRSLVLLHYFEGNEVAALAAQRALTPDAVRAHLRRARAELRTRLCAEPRSQRALLGLAAGVNAVTGTAAAAATLFVSIAMKKLLAGSVVAAAVAVALWFAVDWRDVAAPTAARSDGAVAPAVAAVADESTALREPGRTALPSAAPDVAVTVPFTVALRGLHRDAPWTAIVHLDLDGRDEAKSEWLEFPAHGVPGPDGELALALPLWAATNLRKLRVRADDANYLAFDLREEGALPESRRREIDVQVVAVLTGRVVNEHGTAVPAARVAAFALVAGEPQDGVLAQTNTAADGTFVLQAPPATPLFLVAAAMWEASLSGLRMTGKNGAIDDVGQFRNELLPATKTTTGAVGKAVAVGDFVLPVAASITGTVRWSDGRPVAKAEIGIVPQAGQRLLHFDDRATLEQLSTPAWAPVASVQTDANGEFRLPAAAGGRWSARVRSVPGHVLVGWHVFIRVVAPARTDVSLPLPARVRAVDRGLAVRDAEFLIGNERHRCNDDGELLVVVGDVSSDVDAMSIAAHRGALRSPPQHLTREMAGTVVDLPMRNELAPVAIEFAGEFRVRNARFTFEPLPTGEIVYEAGLRDDRSGPFTFWLVPGRYRVKVRPGGGEWNGLFLLPQEPEFDLPPAGASLVLPARFGGVLEVEAVDERGVRLVGTCAVRDAAGGDHSAAFRAGGNTGGVGELLPGGLNELARILPPGDYDLELDLGSHGIHRRRATIAPRETTNVRVRVP